MTLGPQFDQLQLFDMPEDPGPQANYEPEAWAGRPDITYHASKSKQMPEEGQKGSSGYGPGFHVGTRSSAEERAANFEFETRDFIHPVRMTGSTALRPTEKVEFETESYPPQKKSRLVEPGSTEHPTTWDDWNANYTPGKMAVLAGENVPYVNAHEAKGSVSFRAPRENLTTWAEDVAADPGASRHHKLLAEQFDLTIAAPSTEPKLKRKT